VNHGRFSAPTASRRNRITNDQQYRIDVVSASVPVDSVAREHVLATIFQAQPNDPATRTCVDWDQPCKSFLNRAASSRSAIWRSRARPSRSASMSASSS
jgi:hypothetical protein